MACNIKTAGPRAKQSEIWDSVALVAYQGMYMDGKFIHTLTINTAYNKYGVYMIFQCPRSFGGHLVHLSQNDLQLQNGWS